MKNMKAKLTAVLALAACFSVGFGVNDAIDTAQGTEIVANATDSYTFTALTPLGSSSATAIDAYQEGASKPSGSWAHAYTFVSGTGKGFLWNGED